MRQNLLGSDMKDKNNKEIRIGNIVRLDYEPSFSTGKRKGAFLKVVRIGKSYAVLKDERGISWPLDSGAEVEIITS